MGDSGREYGAVVGNMGDWRTVGAASFPSSQDLVPLRPLPRREQDLSIFLKKEVDRKGGGLWLNLKIKIQKPIQKDLSDSISFIQVHRTRYHYPTIHLLNSADKQQKQE